MCGIAGFFGNGCRAIAGGQLLCRMADSLAHRGPDGMGTFLSSKATLGLAHRRLAIIDLSEDANQPMSDAAGRYWIVFNGEVYNYVSLRAALREKGYQFRTHSDTEVLLALYATAGPEMLDHLRGMFAFAIWDETKQELFLARDRIGAKPLYYALQNGIFLFGSEIKAILQWPDIRRSLNQPALAHYLSFLAVPAPRTLLEGVEKLPAGHYMMVNSSGRVHIQQYWDLAEKAARRAKLDGDLGRQILLLVEEAANLRMVSDVPVSVLLSGGTDSTTIVALLARTSASPLKTFCVGVRGSEANNEFTYARRIAELHRTEHVELEVDLQKDAAVLSKLTEHMDDPIADATSVLSLLIFEKIKAAGFKVTLTGEGSDELFVGYPYWLQVLKARSLLAWARLLPRGLSDIIRSFAARSPHMLRWELLRRVLAREEIFWTGSDGFSEAQQGFFFSDRLKKRVAEYPSRDVISSLARRLAQRASNPDPVQWMTYSEVNLRLPEMLLGRLDRMSMASSVEAREPLLDHHLFEAVFSLPWRTKVGPYEPKYLFKKVIADTVPREVLSRPKVGFNQPLLRWMTPERTRHWQAKVLEFARRTDYFIPAKLESMLSRSHPVHSWYLLSFVLWHERWLEDRPLATLP